MGANEDRIKRFLLVLRMALLGLVKWIEIEYDLRRTDLQ